MAVQFLLKQDSWQLEHYNPRECTVVKLTSGGYGVLDHSIQTLVAKGATAKECQAWIDDH